MIPATSVSMSQRADTRAVEADLVAGGEIGVVVPDIARVELTFELGVIGIDTAVDDPERHSLTGHTAGVGVVRLDAGEPMLVAELLVPGIFPASLLFGLGIEGPIDRAHRPTSAATRKRQCESQGSRRSAGSPFRSRVFRCAPHTCHRRFSGRFGLVSGIRDPVTAPAGRLAPQAYLDDSKTLYSGS